MTTSGSEVQLELMKRFETQVYIEYVWLSQFSFYHRTTFGPRLDHVDGELESRHFHSVFISGNSTNYGVRAMNMLNRRMQCLWRNTIGREKRIDLTERKRDD